MRVCAYAGMRKILNVLGGTVTEPDKKPALRIELTDEQRAKIKKETGKDAKALGLEVEELNDRIIPATIFLF